MTKIKSCLLCENYKTSPCECEHCEDWDNFCISESGKALREKIYGDGYQDGHRDGYDKGHADAQRPQGEWISVDEFMFDWGCNKCQCGIKGSKTRFCPHCGADMRGRENG